MADDAFHGPCTFGRDQAVQFGELRETVKHLAAQVKEQKETIQHLDATIASLDSKLDGLNIARAKADAVVWTLSRLWAGVVAALSVLAWLSINGAPAWLHRALAP
jgi:hypothetical protein